MARLYDSGRLATAMFSFLFSFLFSVLLFTTTTQAIQVTPNSPCASLCIDNSGLDTSDPNSSNTVNADMVCNDADFASTTAGKKWASCMGCLQNSTFSQGSESDQAWFFYNLRYNVDYCVFGYPNASDAVGSSPCQTSTACGPLQDNLFNGIPTMSANQTEFEYCSANGSDLTSTLFHGCIACVGGGGDQNVIANSLIALEAGCLQQLPVDQAVGLSGSVFASATTVSIVAPSETGSSGDDKKSGSSHKVATTTIAVIVVVALLAVAAVCGFAFVCYRKRRGSALHGPGGSKGVGMFRKNKEEAGLYSSDNFTGGGGGGSGGFVPSGGITGSGLGGFVSVPTGGASTRGSPASASGPGPTAWSTRFPSSDHITSPLSFQCRASATSFDEVVDVKGTVETAPPVPVAPSPSTTPLSQSQSQSQSARRQKSTSSMTNSLGIGGSNSHLPSIVESPFPSPAPVPTQPHSQPPRLHQLKTSFSPHLGANSSPSYNTPNSSTALLSSTSSQMASPPTAHGGYNPASYVPQQQQRGAVYQGWSAMVTAAQQYQQQQLQYQSGSVSAVSAGGSYREREREREPISAVSVASSNGLGAATMAARQTFSDQEREPQSATGSIADSASVRLHNKSPHTHTHTRSPHSSKSKSPYTKASHTRSPHTQTELLQTDFLPPPPARTRR